MLLFMYINIVLGLNLELMDVIMRFLYFFVLSLIVKELSLQFFLGKIARNVKFIFEILLASFFSSAIFYIVMYSFSIYLSYFLISIFFSSLLAYLALFIIVYVGSNIIVEYPLYMYIFLKGKFSGGEMLSLLLMINMLSYLLTYLLGFINPLAWM